MTDFYSVLKTSIVRRDLRSPADRLEVYDQARKAMIRKLWSFNPPLAEDEIDTRIGLFDAAVERIEGDLDLAFAEADTAGAERRHERVGQRAQAPEPRRQPMVYEGYDEDADYMPAFGGRSARQEADPVARASDYRTDEDDTPPIPRGYEGRWSTPTGGQDEDTYDQRPEPAAARSRRYDDSWGAPEPDGEPYPDERVDPYYGDPGYAKPELEYHDEPEHRQPRSRAPYPEPEVRAPAYPEPDYSEPSHRGSIYEAYEQPDDDWRDAPRTDRRTAPRRPSPSLWEDEPPVANDEQPYDDRYAASEHGKDKRKSRKVAKPRRDSNRTVRILTITVAGLALFLIGFNVYVFVPIIFGSESAPPTAAAPPPKVDDRVPTVGGPAMSATRISNDSATATEIPTRNLDVAETLVVFDGRDPTVFDATSDNPIQFDSDAEGGFARISSTASAAGARAVVGPGLAERLAGQTIRVTILARSSEENGAAKLRFAYQSGLAVSHWQSADLSSNYGSYGMIWRVPAAHGSNAGDFLLIEPGIPGDGTSTDVRSIRIDILDS